MVGMLCLRLHEKPTRTEMALGKEANANCMGSFEQVDVSNTTTRVLLMTIVSIDMFENLA